uniref:Ubiquitin-like protease family profile domain-containing protein n=1 Tax=Romanomermis culicivorax TaxID=13658 RepID=A0A915K4R2_ROMCU
VGNAKSEHRDRRVTAAARHRLVRTWTKNVNIFDKDFIIIPINENSHWYLAIICYPALFEQEVINRNPLSQATSEFPTTAITTSAQKNGIGVEFYKI